MPHFFNARGNAPGDDHADTLVFPLALILTELLSETCAQKSFCRVYFANPNDLTLDRQVLPYHHHVILAV